MLFIRKILNKLELFINTDDIVVIHGARQVEKFQIKFISFFLSVPMTSLL
jgi:hypothetical protein